MPALVTIRKLSKIWNGWKTRFELHVPELDIAPGELVAMVGPSGSGKSTLLDILGLISRADAAATFSYQSPRLQTPIDLLGLRGGALHRFRREDLGYVLQTGGLLEFLSLRQNIALPARLNRIPEYADRVTSLARELGIERQLSKKPGQVSGGERQRAAIARALIHGPRMILADEPTAALDSVRAAGLMETFHKRCRADGTAVFMVSHNLPLVSAVADRIYEFVLEEIPGTGGVRAECRPLPHTAPPR